MTRIVINRCFGGFALSPAATARYRELGGAGNTSCDGRDLARHDPILVRVVEELGNKANGPYSELEVVEIEGTLYRVTAYDGRETIQTPGDIKWMDAAPPRLPDWGELEDLVKACQGEIGDEYRASEDEEDDQPGMQLTVGWDGKRSWSYQTGDNSFTGGAYSYPHWAVISVYRDSDAEDLASDIRDQLEELNAGA